jgi:hypothetical protein
VNWIGRHWHEHQSHSLWHIPSDSVMFSAYHEYGNNPMALSCRPSTGIIT